MNINMEELTNFCKQYGFIFQGSEIYGGLANTWDFGPLGVELKNNIKKAWWKRFVQEDPSTFGVDAAILMNPKVCEAILVNYSRLKEDSWSRLDSDAWCLVYDFERTCDKALANYPLYMRIVECKIDGMQNKDIQFTIQMEFGIKHSVEYISSLWRKKIPKLIAAAAEDDFLQWYYLNKARGKYKKCSRCGQIKLAHNKYFSKNNTSKDGFYSICKECRNKKPKQILFIKQSDL